MTDNENISQVPDVQEQQETSNQVVSDSPSQEPTQTEQVVVADTNTPEDPDESIIQSFWNKGIREISTSDLISAGFDREKIDTFNIEVGKFKVHRISSLSRYTIDLKSNEGN